MIDVAAKDLKIIQTILLTHVPHCEVRAFGSRVNHTAKPYSDLDLAVVGERKLPDRQFHALKDNASHLGLKRLVIPAKAGTQCSKRLIKHGFTDWTPAFAGETNLK